MRLFAKKKTLGLIRDWEPTFGQPAPRIAALLCSARGGSHFFLHKLQGHPNLLTLKEQVLNTELKNYYNHRLYPMQELFDKQLLPAKAPHDSRIDWIVLNKPKIDHVVYHFPFQREQMRLFQLIRNPITLFTSWAKGWNKMAQRDYGQPQASRERILQWLENHFLGEVMNFSLWSDPKLDVLISLESLTAQPDANLSRVYQALGVAQVAHAELKRLTHCPHCGSELEEQIPDGTAQAFLTCLKCEKTFSAAGGYNYIRKEDPKSLSKWKTSAEGAELYEHFAAKFGDFMHYYRDELYLQPDGDELFGEYFAKLQARLLKLP